MKRRRGIAMKRRNGVGNSKRNEEKKRKCYFVVDEEEEEEEGLKKLCFSNYRRQMNFFGFFSTNGESFGIQISNFGTLGLLLFIFISILKKK